MRLYLAGPMSGIPDFNFPAFMVEATLLRAASHDVVNPAEINPDHGMPWATCMRRDIAQLVTCDGIALLPGWHASRGASLERHIALELGMDVRPAASFREPEDTQLAEVGIGDRVHLFEGEHADGVVMRIAGEHGSERFQILLGWGDSRWVGRAEFRA